MSLDILFNFFTSYQKDKDNEWETNIFFIMFNYCKGMMIFDVTATIPSFFHDGYSIWFCLRFIRFIYVRTVYGSLSEAIRQFLTKMGMDKGSIEKALMIFSLSMGMFSAIHFIGCIWIFIGNVYKCTWLDNGGCSGTFVVDRLND